MRLLKLAGAVAAVGLLVAGCSSATASDHGGSTSPPPPPPSSPRPTQTVTFTATMAALTLPAAVSRPTVFASGGRLLVVGGLTAADRTTEAILRVDLAGGTVQTAGRLPVPAHDAAGAVVNGRDVLFGGGSTAVTSAVQDVTPGASPRVIGHLPQPRADLVAISNGKASYVLGGFNGTQGSTTILRTRDGRTFTVAGTLPVSVRYPAVALSGGSIWLFGGEHAGQQITDVQRVDLSTGQGSVAGKLPRPLAHAGALPAARSDFGVAVVGGTAYLVGGENPKPVNTVIQVRFRTGGAA